MLPATRIRQETERRPAVIHKGKIEYRPYPDYLVLLEVIDHPVLGSLIKKGNHQADK